MKTEPTLAPGVAGEEKRVKVVHEGETVDAEELSFKTLALSSGRYETSDGVTITLTHDAKTIYRLCDKTKSDGSPIYLVTGGVVLKVHSTGKEAK